MKIVGDVKEGIQEKALTPELGGFFEDVKLWVKPQLKVDHQRRRLRYMSQINGEVTFDQMKFMQANTQDTLNLVVGWENLISKKTGEPVPFSTEFRDTVLVNYSDMETGHDTEVPKVNLATGKVMTDGQGEIIKHWRKATLLEYINKFAQDIRNFEKN